MKKSEYHPLVKLVAVLLTIIFAFLAGINALSFLRKGVFYADTGNGIASTPAFANELQNTVWDVYLLKDATEFYEEGLSYEDYLKTDIAKGTIKRYNQKEERALKLFNTIQELKKLRPKTIETNNGTYDVDENGVVYFPEDDSYIAAHEFYNHYNNYYYNGEYSEQVTSVVIYDENDTEIAYPSDDKELFAIKDEYTSYSDWNYKYQQLRSAIFNIVDDAVSEEQIKKEIQDDADDVLYDFYYTDIEETTDRLNEFKNFKFILKNNKSGKVISNVDKADRKNFIKNLDVDSIFYIDFDGKHLHSEQNTVNLTTNLLKFLSEANILRIEEVDKNFLSENFSGYSLYLKIDDKQLVPSPGDSYFHIIGIYNSLSDTDSDTHIRLSVLFSVLSIICFVGCCIISGRRKDGSVKLAINDKVPFVLYLACTVALVGVVGYGVAIVTAMDFDIGDIWGHGETFQCIFTSDFSLSLVGSGFALISLFLLAFVLYIVRNIKAGTFGNRFITIFLFRTIRKVLKKSREKFESRVLTPNQIKRQIKRQTIIPLAVYVAMNLFLYIVSFTDAYPVAVIALIIFNALAMVYAILYLSDVLRLSRIAEEIRNGNLNQKINPKTFVAPLRKFATDLDACRDGIENAINEAIKGEHLKTELITNVSHDLKTPLTSIINYVSLLKMGNIEGEEERKYIDILDEKSKKLKRLIEDLTEASKANSGNIKMNVAQVNLNEMALQAVGENSDVLENAGLDVILTERDKEIIVSADSQHTFRIIDNLFSNAKKYSLTGTRVYVDVYKENGYGVFEIKNISREKLNIDPDELTERFVRGDNSRTTDGSGLGLSIARSFAELQNGIFNIEIDGDMFKAVVKLPLI